MSVWAWILIPILVIRVFGPFTTIGKPRKAITPLQAMGASIAHATDLVLVLLIVGVL
jgi:hypothetical protein